MDAGDGNSGEFDRDSDRQRTNEVPPWPRLVEYCFGHTLDLWGRLIGQRRALHFKSDFVKTC